MTTWSRRRFLRSTSGTALAASTLPLLAWDEACQRTNLTTAQLEAFSKSLDGHVVFPIDPEYAMLRQGYNLLYSHHPMMIVQPAGLDDVKRAVLFARDHGIDLSPRSGGHNYCGWSTCDGMVLDFSLMNTISVTADDSMATIGPGVQLIYMYDTLSCQHQCSLPGGTCPTVGMTGFTLGGGFGGYSRAWGFMCDRLKAVQMVKADGTHVDAAVGGPNEHLLKACRGGGGGSFGIVTKMGFTPALHNLAANSNVVINFADAEAFLEVYQDFAYEAPDEFGSLMSLGAGATSRYVNLSAWAIGDKQGNPPTTVWWNSVNHLKQRLKKVGVSFQNNPQPTDMTIAEIALQAGGLSHLQPCDLPPDINETSGFKATSVYITDTMDSNTITTLVDHISELYQSETFPTSRGYISMDAYGGVLGTEPEGGSVMVHRTSRFVSQILGYWHANTTQKEIDDNIKWVRRGREVLAPLTSYGAYVNYCDDAIENWPTAYWGSAYPFLQQVKQEFDPSNFFHFPQSVQLP